MENINLSLENYNGSELIIRTGDAPDAVNYKPVNISGTITCAHEWASKKLAGGNRLIKDSHVLVDRQQGAITLVVSESSELKDTILGKIEKHSDLAKFRINTGEYFTNFELANLFKMNRAAFETPTENMRLVSELKNFSAKIDKEIEKKNDGRGNTRELKAQIVSSNIPESFKLKIGVIKGCLKEIINVEVDVNADNLNFSLVSPDAAEIFDTYAENVINREVGLFTAEFPGLALLEV